VKCFPLNVEIWQSFDQKDTSYIPQNELSTRQSEEFKRLDEFMNEKLSQLGVNTSPYLIQINKTGYTVKRFCHQNGRICRAVWFFKVDVDTNEGSIYFNEKCDHFIV
jgi:hypothetical protein